MKFVAILLSLGLCLPAFAEAPDGFKKGEKFDQAKARMLENIEKRMKSFEKHKEWISGATDKAGLKKCRLEMQSFRTEMKEKRKDMKKKRKGY